MFLHLFSQTIPNITTRVSIECPRKPPFAPKVNIIWSATECLPSTNQLLLHGSAEEHILRRFSFSVAGNCIIALHQLIDVTAVGGLRGVVAVILGEAKTNRPRQKGKLCYFIQNDTNGSVEIRGAVSCLVKSLSIHNRQTYAVPWAFYFDCH